MSNERKRRISTSAMKESANGAHAADSAESMDGEAARSQADASPVPEPLAFEEALGRLDEMVSLLEEGQVSLEDALTLYEEGVRMAQRCQQMLDQAELRLQRLVVRRDDEDVVSPTTPTYVLESFMMDEDR